MQNSPDRFCALMAEVTCRACPIRTVDEESWKTGLRPGVTPFEAATQIGDEVYDVYEENLTEIDEQDDFVDEDDSVDAPTQAELRGDDVAEALHATILPLSDDIWQAVERVYEASEEDRPTVTIIQALGACVQRQFDGECAFGDLFSQTIEAMPGLVDRGMGAAVLHTIARHGSADEVRRIAMRIQDVVEDIIARATLESDQTLVDVNTIPEVSLRAYLMRVAEVLENRAPEDD